MVAVPGPRHPRSVIVVVGSCFNIGNREFFGTLAVEQVFCHGAKEKQLSENTDPFFLFFDILEQANDPPCWLTKFFFGEIAPTSYLVLYHANRHQMLASKKIVKKRLNSLALAKVGNGLVQIKKGKMEAIKCQKSKADQKVQPQRTNLLP